MFKQMIDISGIKRLVNVLAVDSNLTVQFVNKNVVPCTDGKKIILQNPVSTWPKEKFVEWWGALYHEISHNYPETRDCFELQRVKGIDMKSLTGNCINIMIDYEIELFKLGEYLGRDRALDEYNTMLLSPNVGKGRFGTVTVEEDKNTNVIQALCVFDILCRSSWQHGLIGIGEEFYDELQPEAKEWVDKLLDNPLKYQANCPPHDDAFSIYDKLMLMYKEVFDIDADEQQKQDCSKPDGQKGDGDAEPKEGEGEEGDGEGKECDGDSKGLKARKKAAEVLLSELLKHKHDDSKSGATYTPMTIKYDVIDSCKFQADKINIKDYSKGQHNLGTDHFYAERHQDGLNEIKELGRGLSNTVRRLLQIRSKSKREYGKKRGKINGKALFRLSVPNSGSYSEKVFSQKVVNNMLDVSVTVLGDMSGSMGGDKYVYMAHSCIMLHEAITPLKIPLEILGFTEEHEFSTICIYKTFKSTTNAEWLTNDFVSGTAHMGNNADGEALQWAYHRLMNQHSKRKILIVLSDGQPASTRRGESEHLKEVVRHIENSGSVEVYAIGIQSNAVENFYNDYTVIQRPEELEEALLNVISTKIIQ